MLIGLTGRIASGKGVVAECLKSKGFEYVKISQFLHDEAKRLGIPSKRGSLQDLGNKFRKEEGAGFLAKRFLDKINLSKNYAVDGIRNHKEVTELKKAKNFFLISVDALQKIRFERILSRKKEYDPKNWEEFIRADKRDFGIGEPEDGQQVGKCMALADFHISNDSSPENFHKKIEEIYKKIMEEKC